MYGSRRQVLRYMTAAAAVVAAPLPAFALDAAAARDHVAVFSARLIGIVDNGDSIEQKRAQFASALKDGAAIDDIARVVIGRIWSTMSEGQRVRYVDAFMDYLTNTFTKRFSDFSGQSIEIGSATDAGKSGVIVASVISGGSKPVEVEWRVIDRGGKPKVFDVYVAGASLLVTQQSEFKAILDRNGNNVDALIDQISGG